MPLDKKVVDELLYRANGGQRRYVTTFPLHSCDHKIVSPRIFWNEDATEIITLHNSR